MSLFLCSNSNFVVLIAIITVFFGIDAIISVGDNNNNDWDGNNKLINNDWNHQLPQYQHNQKLIQRFVNSMSSKLVIT